MTGDDTGVDDEEGDGRPERPTQEQERGSGLVEIDRRRTILGALGIGSLGVAYGLTRLGGDNDSYIPNSIEYAFSGPIQWRFGTRVSSSPVVAEGLVLVGGSQGDASLYALHATRGGVAWRFPARVPAAPAVSGGTAYFGSSDGTLTAIELADGSPDWDAFVGRSTASPTVGDDGVFAAGDGSITALDATSGDLRWESDDDRFRSWERPATADGLVVVGGREGTVYALDASDGSIAWEFATGEDRCAAPTVVDDTVYLGTSSGAGPSRSAVYALDATDGTERWRSETPDAIRSRPTVAQDGVYVGCHDPVYYRGHAYAFDPSDGSELWRVRTEGDVSTSPTVADGSVFVTSTTAQPGTAADEQFDVNRVGASRGRIFDGALFALDRTTGRVLSRFDTGSGITTPAVTDGTVYVGSREDETVYALDAGALVEA
jgi:outer membrane protein assembly factor BamB